MWSAIVIILTFTAGSAFIMWLGEQINQKGIGNGISIILFCGIVSRGPSMVQSLVTRLQTGTLNIVKTILILLIAIAL